MEIINRHELFLWFCKSNTGYEQSTLISVFLKLTDEDLCETYNLKVLRKGFFVRK